MLQSLEGFRADPTFLYKHHGESLGHPVELYTTASRALRRMPGPATSIPLVVAVCAGEPSLIVSHLVIAALQKNCLPFNDCLCDDLSGLLNDPAESGPGHTHPQTGFLLRESFQISQAQGFHLIDGQPDFLHLSQGDSPRLEIADRGITGNNAIFLWSGQISLHFGHILNIHPILINSRPPDVNSTLRHGPPCCIQRPPDPRKKRRCAILATGVLIHRPAHEGHGHKVVCKN